MNLDFRPPSDTDDRFSEVLADAFSGVPELPNDRVNAIYLGMALALGYPEWAKAFQSQSTCPWFDLTDEVLLGIVEAVPIEVRDV